MSIIDRTTITMHPLHEYLTEYKELNSDNKYRPVAVGRYGIRARESIYSKELAKDYSKNRLIFKGTLTVGMGSVQMDIGILSDDAIYSVSPAYHTYKIAGIDCDYLRYCLQCRNMDMFARYMKRGSRQGKSIDLDRWITYEIPVYPVQAQKAIVDRLDRVQRVIDARQRELTTLDELCKARFVEMFGDNDKYLYEPLNYNVCEMFIGPFGSALKNECFVEQEDGYCIVYEQKHAIKKTMDVPTRYVDENKYLELKRFSVYPGDIIVSCRGTIGEIFVVPEGAPLGIMHPSIMKIRLNTERYDQKFFVLALERYMEEHNNETKGSGVKMAVTATTLGQELFVVPPMDVQKNFSTFVEQVDKSKVVA